MRRLIRMLTTVGVVGLVGGSAHGVSGNSNPLNKVRITQVHGFDGWAKMVRAGNKDTFDTLKVQKVTATTSCRVSGDRAWKVGPKVFPDPRTTKQKFVTRSHTWVPGIDEASPVSNFGNVCRSADRAAYLPIKVYGNCKRSLAPFLGASTKGKWYNTTKKLPFALDCQGYPPSDRTALVNFWHAQKKDNFSLPFHKRSFATNQGYVHAWVIGQIYKSKNSARRELKWMQRSNPKLWALASNPATIAQMQQQGWKPVSPVHRVVGYVKKTGGGGTVPLHSYEHPGRKDWAVGSRPDIIQKLKSAGYKHRRTEGYIHPIKP